jgi:hypothetical protein
MKAYELAGQFFSSLSRARGDSTDLAVGPKLPTLFSTNGIEPLGVHLFPVSRAQLGAPADAVWANRREAVLQAMEKAPDEAINRIGQDYLKQLDRYAAAAKTAGAGFVEIQNTMLFATVGERRE